MSGHEPTADLHGSKPISSYALIGDLHTAALVGSDGAIDWLCLPHYDSGACFAALLGDESRGHWTLAPSSGGQATSHAYDDDTLILRSRWETEDGTVEVVDFMPPRGHAADVVRIVQGVAGRVSMTSTLRLRFDYGRVRPWVRLGEGVAAPAGAHDDRHGGAAGSVRSSDDPDASRDAAATAGPDSVWVHADVPLCHDGDALRATFEVAAGDEVAFVLTHRASHLPRPPMAQAGPALAQTRTFWEEWIGRCSYTGRWAPEVRRSLLLLKALTFAPTGGILAAATTSLPEQLGGVRNWDYRYCWLRDATFTLQALLGTGYTDEAKAWREWLIRAVAGDPEKLQIMYGLDGTQRIPEHTLDWLPGYAGSAPVRVGNAAADQRQLDVWGEVLNGLYLARESGLEVAESAWDVQLALLDWLESNWQEPDNGLWEMRGPRRNFVHSKVMAWAGVDRAIRTVEQHRLDGPVDRWRALAAQMHDEVCRRGYDADRETFTQFYGSHGLDAALLLLPRVGFLPWDDPRVRGTVRAVQRELTRDGFLLRYDPEADGGPDGLPGTEAAFLACSFWLADALHGIGETDEAEALFTKLIGLRNDVGMLSEEYSAAHGQLGNTPQAFSLVGLVNTARHLSDPSGHGYDTA
ncbi:Glucoamylase (glucan-1,4-alpha-glucosidase), GH15 family [Nocardioides terrae]|uniref:Trehalase n=1 Tax=Nocardioides terrae TaxID=574651 RepID=A0A1I1KUQ3_9ACTN|nr:glycoside hydrolase family 15 protein [Nocardioides terrae]SFC64471.1 Glucoamylase (glucan-1,4-alpha-glucosidase), GH15 family [Nocardioides terrae]